MSAKILNVQSLKLIGGNLSMDFMNTVDWRGTKTPREFLNSYSDLILWGLHVKLTTDDEARMLRKKADENAVEAEEILRQAVELRETIYGIFTALADGSPVPETNLSVFNTYLSSVMGESRIVQTDEGFAWGTQESSTDLRGILSPIIRDSADLLVSGEWEKVKKCADRACGWMFLDSSRNRSRRWCDMKDCGNRAKASRFYQKKKQIHSPSS